MNDKKRMKITEVGVVVDTIKKISDKDYQKRIWVRHEDMDKIVDSYDDTTMYFGEDSDAVLKYADEIEMTDKQHEMLKKLNEMVTAYDMSDERPDEAKEIVEDPKWDEIRSYAKLVYEELTE